jgi:hypothetical protein
MRARVWAGMLVLLLLGATRIVLGQDDSHHIEVVLVGGGTETGSLVDTMRELLGRLGLVPNVHAVSTIEDADKIERGSSAARVQIDLRSDKETTITATNKEGAQHVRKLHRDPSPSIAREELAHAVQTVVEAQLFPDAHHDAPDAAAPAPTPEPSETAPPPPPIVTAEPAPIAPSHDKVSPAPKSPLALDVGVIAGGAGFSDNSGPVARLGAGAALVWRKGWNPSAGVDVHYILPFDATGKEVAAHTSDLVLRTMFGLQPIQTSWLGIHAGAGVGIDVVMVDPRSGTLGASALEKGTTRVDPMISAALGADLKLVSPVVLTLRFITDFDVGDTHHYVMLSNAGEEVVFSPWHVRPAIVMGLTFTPFGKAP